MHERDFLLFESILLHIELIEQRFRNIEKADDFIETTEGNILLDAIAIRLQALSENTKKIFKKNPGLENQYPLANWNEIIRFRDLISHHYEILNHQIIFSICKEHIPVLKKIIQKIISERS